MFDVINRERWNDDEEILQVRVLGIFEIRRERGDKKLLEKKFVIIR
jgi:hypothetical protein